MCSRQQSPPFLPPRKSQGRAVASVRGAGPRGPRAALQGGAQGCAHTGGRGAHIHLHVQLHRSRRWTHIAPLTALTCCPAHAFETQLTPRMRRPTGSWQSQWRAAAATSSARRCARQSARASARSSLKWSLQRRREPRRFGAAAAAAGGEALPCARSSVSVKRCARWQWRQAGEGGGSKGKGQGGCFRLGAGGEQGRVCRKRRSSEQRLQAKACRRRRCFIRPAAISTRLLLTRATYSGPN